VDLLFEEPSEGRPLLVLVDFKTDRWDGTAAGLERLVDAYAPQLQLYQEGLRRALGRPVDEAWLYFLEADQPVLVPAPKSDEEWLSILRAATVVEPEDGSRGPEEGVPA